MSTLVIYVTSEDPSDIDFVRDRAVGTVETLVEELTDEERFDGNVTVAWDMQD